MELESERAKQSQSQLEKTQMARERAHKQRVKGLEEQVSCVSQHLSVSCHVSSWCYLVRKMRGREWCYYFLICQFV